MSEVLASLYATHREFGRVFVEFAPSSRVQQLSAVALHAKRELRATCLLDEATDRWVLMLPDWGLPLRVRVRATLDDGTVDEAELSVDPNALAGLEAVDVTVADEPTSDGSADPEATRQRLLDIVSRERLHTEVGRVTTSPEGDVVTGFASFSTSHAQRSDADYDLLFFDQSGKLLPSPWQCMGDGIVADRHFDGIHQRTLSFSIELPAAVDSFCVWLQSSDPSIPAAFDMADAALLGERRGFWRNETMVADADPTYERWFLELHRADSRTLALQRATQGSLPIRPLFSFVVPLFHTPLDFLRDAVDSVLRQSYPKLELVLVNASPEENELCAAIERYRARDARVRVVTLEGNLGITENTNAGIRAATGDFLAFMDHDDTIEPDLLYCYAKAINDHPETDLLYCDEDHLLDDHYVGPFFKPDWDIDRLCTENYVCHLLCVRKSFVDALPELPSREMDGSQDHNMTFLVGEQARSVYHVRRVLYHWRMHAASTAGAGVDQKSYALEAERLAVQNHLDRCGIDATARMNVFRHGRCHVDYHFATHPLVSIIIPNKDSIDLLDACVTSILDKSSWPNYEVIVIENNSSEPETFAYYEQLAMRDERVRIASCETGGVFNFSMLMNAGAREAKGDYLLLLNNDTEVVSPDWIEQLMGPALREEVGCVGALLLYPNGTIQHAGVLAGRVYGPQHFNAGRMADDPGYYEVNELTHQATAVTAACLLTKKAVFWEIGGFDESFAANYNDVDFCLKVRERRYAIVYQPHAKLIHHESVSRDSNSGSARARARFVREEGGMRAKWAQVLCSPDPFYNPNFRFGPAFYHLDDSRKLPA
jgi:GT2 family glycosyltransferase